MAHCYPESDAFRNNVLGRLFRLHLLDQSFHGTKCPSRVKSMSPFRHSSITEHHDTCSWGGGATLASLLSLLQHHSLEIPLVSLEAALQSLHTCGFTPKCQET
eukprot:4735642-Amphidinium_carterae.1